MNQSREQLERAYRERMQMVRLAFAERTRGDAAGLRTAIDALPAEAAAAALRDIAHQLRGTAGTLGFRALSDASAKLEDAIDAAAGPAELARLGEALAAMMGNLDADRAA